MIDVQLSVFEGVPIHVSDKSQEERLIAVDFRAGQGRLLLSIEKAAELVKKLGTEVSKQKMLMAGEGVKTMLADRDWVEAIIGLNFNAGSDGVVIFLVTTVPSGKNEELCALAAEKEDVAVALSKALDCDVKIWLHYSGKDFGESPNSLGQEYHYFYEKEQPAEVEDLAACHQ